MHPPVKSALDDNGQDSLSQLTVPQDPELLDKLGIDPTELHIVIAGSTVDVLKIPSSDWWVSHDPQVEQVKFLWILVRSLTNEKGLVVISPWSDITDARTQLQALKKAYSLTGRIERSPQNDYPTRDKDVIVRRRVRVLAVGPDSDAPSETAFQLLRVNTNPKLKEKADLDWKVIQTLQTFQGDRLSELWDVLKAQKIQCDLDSLRASLKRITTLTNAAPNEIQRSREFDRGPKRQRTRLPAQKPLIFKSDLSEEALAAYTEKVPVFERQITYQEFVTQNYDPDRRLEEITRQLPGWNSPDRVSIPILVNHLLKNAFFPFPDRSNDRQAHVSMEISMLEPSDPEEPRVVNIRIRQPSSTQADWNRLEVNHRGWVNHDLFYFARPELRGDEGALRPAGPSNPAGTGHGLLLVARVLAETPALLKFTRSSDPPYSLQTDLYIALRDRGTPRPNVSAGRLAIWLPFLLVAAAAAQIVLGHFLPEAGQPALPVLQAGFSSILGLGALLTAAFQPRYAPEGGGSGSGDSAPASGVAATDVVSKLQIYGVPVETDSRGTYVSPSQMPQAPWVMDRMRDPEQGALYPIHDIPSLTLSFPLHELPALSRDSLSINSSGVFLGFVNELDHPVAIKVLNRDQGDTELMNAQILGRIGGNPAFYGVIRLSDGGLAYAMQAVRCLPLAESLDSQDKQYLAERELLKKRAMTLAGISLIAFRRTPEGHAIGIDAGDAGVVDAITYGRYIAERTAAAPKRNVWMPILIAVSAAAHMALEHLQSSILGFGLLNGPIDMAGLDWFAEAMVSQAGGPAIALGFLACALFQRLWAPADRGYGSGDTSPTTTPAENATSPAPTFRSAGELFGSTVLDRHPGAALGDPAPEATPSPGYTRPLDQATLDRVAALLERRGLGFLRRVVGITRVQVTEKHAALYLIRSTIQHLLFTKSIFQEIIVPDFETNKMLTRILARLHELFDPVTLLNSLSQTDVYQDLPEPIRQRLAEARKQLPPSRTMSESNQDTLRLIVTIGLLHELGRVIWDWMRQLGDDPPGIDEEELAADKLNEWRRLADAADPDLLWVRAALNAYGPGRREDGSNTFPAQLFAEKFAVWAYPPLSRYFGVKLSEKETQFFDELAIFLQATTAQPGPIVPAGVSDFSVDIFIAGVVLDSPEGEKVAAASKAYHAAKEVVTRLQNQHRSKGHSPIHGDRDLEERTLVARTRDMQTRERELREALAAAAHSEQPHYFNGVLNALVRLFVAGQLPADDHTFEDFLRQNREVKESQDAWIQDHRDSEEGVFSLKTLRFVAWKAVHAALLTKLHRDNGEAMWHALQRVEQRLKALPKKERSELIKDKAFIEGVKSYARKAGADVHAEWNSTSQEGIAGVVIGPSQTNRSAVARSDAAPAAGDTAGDEKVSISLDGAATLRTRSSALAIQDLLHPAIPIRVMNDEAGRLVSGRTQLWTVWDTPLDKFETDLDFHILTYLKTLLERYPGRRITVVDWGCGSGKAISELARLAKELSPNLRLIGYSDQIYRDWNEAPENVTFILDTADQLPGYFNDGDIDLVVSHHGFSKLGADYIGHLRQMHGRMAPHGIIRHHNAGWSIRIHQALPEYSIRYFPSKWRRHVIEFAPLLVHLDPALALDQEARRGEKHASPTPKANETQTQPAPFLLQAIEHHQPDDTFPLIHLRSSKTKEPFQIRLRQWNPLDFSIEASGRPIGELRLKRLSNALELSRIQLYERYERRGISDAVIQWLSGQLDERHPALELSTRKANVRSSLVRHFSDVQIRTHAGYVPLSDLTGRLQFGFKRLRRFRAMQPKQPIDEPSVATPTSDISLKTTSIFVAGILQAPLWGYGLSHILSGTPGLSMGHLLIGAGWSSLPIATALFLTGGFLAAVIPLSPPNPADKVRLLGSQGKWPGDALLEELVRLVQKKPSMKQQDIQWRGYRITEILWQILDQHLGFDGHTIIYPAGGADGLPSRFADTIVLNRDRLENQARETFSLPKPGTHRLTYLTLDAASPANYNQVRSDIKTPQTTLLLKGLEWMLPTSKFFVRRLRAICNVLQPNRVIILRREDAAAVVPVLAGLGYRERTDWIDRTRKRVLEAIFNYMSISVLDEVQTPSGPTFMIPNTIRLFERNKGQQTMADRTPRHRANRKTIALLAAATLDGGLLAWGWGHVLDGAQMPLVTQAAFLAMPTFSLSTAAALFLAGGALVSIITKQTRISREFNRPSRTPSPFRQAA